jgi:hypothetical protein
MKFKKKTFYFISETFILSVCLEINCENIYQAYSAIYVLIFL